MITLRNITLQRGSKILFENVNFALHANQKIGIVGKNGSGKSSLFALLLREIDADKGEIELASNLHLACIKQDIPDSDRRCIDYVIDADTQLRRIEQQLKDAEEKNDGLLIGQALMHYENLEGYSAHARAASLLSGLGFTEQQQTAPLNTLSGGWRMQLNLARALFVRSDALLLDEPTNHLDLDAVIWLEQFLKKYRGLLLLISHDRDFLDNIVTSILHLEHQRIKFYQGNYSSFAEQYAEQLALQQKTQLKQQHQIQHWQKFVDRFRAKASKAKQVQSRIKALEKMALVSIDDPEHELTFSFPKPKTVPHDLLILRDIAFSYPDQQIFERLNWKITCDMRIGLLGANGAGKSTLIKILLGELQPQVGEVVYNDATKIGYFAQHQLEQLDKASTPLQQLQQLDDAASEQTLRTFLGSFDFKKEMALQNIGSLSGGEKARLALALLIWQKPNLLLLDEPTNHLDFPMRQALALALQEYRGALILVSHDRFLLRSTVNEFYLVANKKISAFSGDLIDYQNWLLQYREQQNASQNLDDNEEKPKQISLVEQRQQKKEIQKIERELQKAQIELENIMQILADPNIYAKDRQKDLQVYLSKKRELEDEIKTLERNWFLLQETMIA